VHDIRLTACLALSRPCPGEHDAAPMQPFVQPLANRRKELSVGIVSYVREAPVDSEMRHQRKADRFCKFDRLNDIAGLSQGEALARAQLLPGLRCRDAPVRSTDRRNSAADPAVRLCIWLVPRRGTCSRAAASWAALSRRPRPLQTGATALLILLSVSA
jgi:hypothetical protein